jgi:hypothetical protein
LDVLGGTRSSGGDSGLVTRIAHCYHPGVWSSGLDGPHAIERDEARSEGRLEVEITAFRAIVWRQFGAAIDMLENAIVVCPEKLWSDRSRRPQYWYLVYHTLFWLDLYLSGSIEGFAPPAPFALEELDPAGLLPERPYTKDELRTYLEHCRNKCRETIEGLTEETARRNCVFGWGQATFGELFLYNMRHVQHGAAQLNLILRREVDSVPRWVATAGDERAGR